MRLIPLLTAIAILAYSTQASSQEFDITETGELELESDQIVEPGVVSEYFGMNVDGFGPAMLQVSARGITFVDEFEFQVNPTQLYSFLLANDLVDGIGIAFRRGVTGAVDVAVLNAQGVLQDSVTIQFNVTRKKRECTKHPSETLKGCKAVNLESAKPKQVKLFLRKFLDSIRGPIVLEPKAEEANR